jgi:DNA-directed RNA polymerase specialized sigma24 family protein
MISSFQNTQWTLVLRASGVGVEAQAALSDLCGAYYTPVVAFLRRDGRGDDEAREMAHGFFAGLLEGGLGTPEQARGRFRSYLLGAVKHFLSKQREVAGAQKRGGGVQHVALDMAGEIIDEDKGARCPLSLEDDALMFDREWAFTVIARALANLEAEHEAKREFYQTLKPWLDGAADVSQAQTAATLGMSETAVKVAIHRLRTRFRELIRAEVAATVNDPEDAADELRHLIEIVSRG